MRPWSVAIPAATIQLIPRCGGADHASCGAVRDGHFAGIQEADARAAQATQRRRESTRQRDRRREPVVLATSVDEFGPDDAWVELARARRCPRPDKQCWHTLDAADQILTQMRTRGLPGCESINGYLCIAEKCPSETGCAAHHAVAAEPRTTHSKMTAETLAAPAGSLRRSVMSPAGGTSQIRTTGDLQAVLMCGVNGCASA